MSSLEPKKLALLRVLQILKEHSDYDHPLTQNDIADYLETEYGIVLERKAISSNLSLLREAGYEISPSNKMGSYLEEREFEDSELRLLIDGVLSSKYITARHSKDLIEKLCGMANEYFRSHVKNIYSVNDWSKTDNQALFYNIEIIDKAIEENKQIQFDYNKYGVDKKLHVSSFNRATPYQLILHNQRYYLMAFNEYWKNLTFYRVDHISKITLRDKPATPITEVPGFEAGIDYKEISSALPYMYTDKIEYIEFLADKNIIDHIIEWFGYDIKILEQENDKILVMLKASPLAMNHWAMQYINHVEILKPLSLRKQIKESIKLAAEKYK